MWHELRATLRIVQIQRVARHIRREVVAVVHEDKTRTARDNQCDKFERDPGQMMYEVVMTITLDGDEVATMEVTRTAK